MNRLVNINFIAILIVTALFSSSCCSANEKLFGIAEYRPYGWSEYLAILNVKENSDLKDLDQAISSMEMIITKDRITKKSFFDGLINQMVINVETNDLKDHLSNLEIMKSFFRGSLEKSDHVVIRQIGSNALIYINDVLFTFIESPLFLRLLSQSWIGNVPPSSKFKSDLIGGELNQDLVNSAKSHKYSLLRQNIIRDWRYTYENDNSYEQGTGEKQLIVGERTSNRAEDAKPENVINEEVINEEVINEEVEQIKVELASVEVPDVASRVKSQAQLKSIPKKIEEDKDKSSENLPKPVKKIKNEKLEFKTKPKTLSEEYMVATTSKAVIKESAIAIFEENKNDASSLNTEKFKIAEKKVPPKTRKLAVPKSEDSDLKKKDITFESQEIFEEYRVRALREINRHKAIPKKAIVKRHNGDVSVLVEVDKNGNIVKIEIVEPSRYRSLNKQAIEAVEKASPLSPIPKELGVNKLALNIQISYPKYF